MDIRLPSSPSRWLSLSFSKPRSLDVQPGTERRRRGAMGPPGDPGLCGRSGGRGTCPIPQAAERQARQGSEGPGGLHRPWTSARPQGWALGRGVAPRRGVARRGLACEILLVGWGWGYFGAKWEELWVGAHAVGTRRSPALLGSPASGLTGSCGRRTA